MSRIQEMQVRSGGPARIGAALLASLALVAGLSGAAQAQVSEQVDPSELESWRLDTDNTLQFCQFEGAATQSFDRAVGEALADSLLLESEFATLPTGYGIGGEYVAEDLFVALTNDCDVILGMGVAGLFPSEFTITRPYATFSYVLGVADPDVDAITGIPSDQRLGARVGSYGFLALSRYIATRPEAEQWQALPYGTVDLMVERVLDGTIGGMVAFGPELADLPDAGDLKIISLDDTVAASAALGGLMLSRNTFLRSLLDDAIAALVEDGTIATLLEENGFEAIPAVPGGG